MAKLRLASDDERISRHILFFVEGANTEFYLLRKIFCDIYGYEMVQKKREVDYKLDDRIKIFNKPKNRRVYVVNTPSSNIKSIGRDERGREFMDKLYDTLVSEYRLPIQDTAVYCLLDRDQKSNTDADFIRAMLPKLRNAHDNSPPDGNDRRRLREARQNNRRKLREPPDGNNSEDNLQQGLLLLSYPCIESFTAMNFVQDSLAYCWNKRISIGDELKRKLNDDKILQNKIDASTLLYCARELLSGLQAAGVDTERDALYNSFDDFSGNNGAVFECQEDCYRVHTAYGCLSLLCVALLDLGLIRMEE